MVKLIVQKICLKIEKVGNTRAIPTNNKIKLNVFLLHDR